MLAMKYAFLRSCDTCMVRVLPSLIKLCMNISKNFISSGAIRIWQYNWAIWALKPVKSQLLFAEKNGCGHSFRIWNK